MPSAKTPTPPKRRKVNVETNEPTRPAYEIAGERMFFANRTKNAATSEEKKAGEEVLREMVIAKKENFDIKVDVPNVGTITVDFLIDREDDVQLDVQELYKKVLAKEITMEDFVSVCKVTQGDVKNKFGSLVLAAISKPKPKEDPKLKMKVRK